MAAGGASGTSRPGVRNRLRYAFDNLLARGTWAVLLWLGAVTLLAVLVSSTLLSVSGVELAGSQDSSWLEDFWQSLLRVFDPGTMAGDVGWGRRVLALLITMFGVLIAGTLIGLIASGVEQRVEELRRGRSVVVERDHVVVLGASNRLPILVEQLVLADEGRRARAVVVLADREPVALREDVQAAIGSVRTRRVVFRAGDPARPSDLAMVAVRDARAVIVLATGDAACDGPVVSAVLAVCDALGGVDGVPVVAELSDPDVAAALRRATGDAVHPVVVPQSLARLTAFALREPDLRPVIEELLDVRGCDVHVRPVGDLAGATFGDCVLGFDAVRPIGVARADGGVELHPDPSTALGGGDRLVVLAHDAEAALEASRLGRAPADAVRATGAVGAVTHRRREEHVLLAGWSALGAHLVAELGDFAAPGSTLELIYDPATLDADDVRVPSDAIAVTRTPASRPWRRVHGMPTSQLTTILLLADRDPTAFDDSDSRILLTHRLLRRELDARGGPSPRIVLELRDERHRDLAHVDGTPDHVISDDITSRLMTQLATLPERRAVLLTLYADDGPSLRLVGPDSIGLAGEVRWEQVVASAYAAGLLAIGWRAGDRVVLGPGRATPVRLDAAVVVVIG